MVFAVISKILTWGILYLLLNYFTFIQELENK